MSGKPGMKGKGLGGRRRGAGRKQSRVVLRVGEKFALSIQMAEGLTPIQLCTVVSVSGKRRGSKHLIVMSV